MKNQFKIINNMGITWTLFRARYEFKRKAGLLHRKFTPNPLSNADFFQYVKSDQINDEESLFQYLNKRRQRFFFDDSRSISLGFKDELISILTDEKKEMVVKKADSIMDNNFHYFSKRKVGYTKADWHYSPFTEKKSPADKHWLDISDLTSDFGDIKFIWELSRFPFAYDLVRAYVLKEDDKYVEKYWNLVEDWIVNNPAEYGVNYKCGQEMSLRIMAWLFGLYAFLDHKETTPSRVTTLLKTIYQHADHVEKHFDFALKSVKNNHTISEAAGMYTVGLLFPFMDKAKKWKEKGKKYLEKEAKWQIYDDGSYIQNSMNYHRLMLQDYTWVLRLGELNNDSFSQKLIDRLKKSVKFLYQQQLNANGRLPNYGMNDGALIHPLSTNDYLDYRPQLSAAWMALTGQRLYSTDTHDEHFLWLFGPNAFQKKPANLQRYSQEFPNGGYYTFRNADSFGMTRCTSFKHRPAQADMLHFDLWINDINVLADAGTYSYNTDANYLAYFNGTSSHNTVMINQKDQMQKGSRFIWLDWTKSKLLKYETNDQYTIFEGEHYGYRPLTHRRGILNIDEHWVIVDDVFGNFNNQSNSIQLSWLFGIDTIDKTSNDEWKLKVGQDNYKITVFLSNNTEDTLYYGSEDPFKGWQSLYYGEKQKKPQLVLTSNQTANMRFVTIITKDDTSITCKNDSVCLNDLVIDLLPIGASNIFTNIKDET